VQNRNVYGAEKTNLREKYLGDLTRYKSQTTSGNDTIFNSKP